jgi:hypothetical protein
MKCKKVFKFGASVLGAAIAFASTPAQAQTGDEPLVTSLVSDLRISEEEANRRVQVMREAAKLAARLETEEPVRFAGLYVEHQPTFRVVVKLVGNADGLLARYTSDTAFVRESGRAAPRSD